MMPGGGGVAMPPPAMINNGAGAGPFPNDRSVIVLNNQKPRSKSTKKKEFSFRNIKKSIVPSSAITPMQDQQLLQQVPFGLGNTNQQRDPQFTIGFRLGPDGNIVDIENAPSPTPTFINNSSSLFEQQQLLQNKSSRQHLGRKSISKEDHYPQKKNYYEDEDYY